MPELTKEYFDKALSSLATKDELTEQAERLERKLDEQTEALARMVNTGFEDIRRRLDVRDDQVDELKTQMREVRKEPKLA